MNKNRQHHLRSHPRGTQFLHFTNNFFGTPLTPPSNPHPKDKKKKRDEFHQSFLLSAGFSGASRTTSIHQAPSGPNSYPKNTIPLITRNLISIKPSPLLVCITATTHPELATAQLPFRQVASGGFNTGFLELHRRAPWIVVPLPPSLRAVKLRHNPKKAKKAKLGTSRVHRLVRDTHTSYAPSSLPRRDTQSSLLITLVEDHRQQFPLPITP